MSDDALFDVFDQEEPSAIVEVPKSTATPEQTTAAAVPKPM